MTDSAFLFHVLEDGRWHSQNEILERSMRERGCGLTVHSRAADLRKRGCMVENQLRHTGTGRASSYYRLVLEEADPCGTVSASSSTPPNPETPGRVQPSFPAVSASESTDRRDEGVLLLFDSHDQATINPGAYGDAA